MEGTMLSGPLESRSRNSADRIAAAIRRARALAAERLRLVDALRMNFEVEFGATWAAPDDLAWRDLRAEAAAALDVHERSAENELYLARRLAGDFLATLVGLGDGRFSERHARIVVHESTGLPSHLLPDYERELLEVAHELSASRFEKYARQIRASLDPTALVERYRDAVAQRRVAVEAAPDGMAWFGALLSAEDAIGASAAVSGIARGLLIDGETRTRSQIEADVFRDLLTDSRGVIAPANHGEAPVASPAARRGVRAEVLIHVPVLTAMGHGDAPGSLDGYGPIDAETARRLCAEAPGFIRVLTDPEDGATLSFGRTAYRVPAELRRLLRMRDEVCRFVGCSRAAAHCDIDHTVPWQEDGETVDTNLAHLCRGHHRLKERGRWKIGREPHVILTWTSPTGRTYRTRPAPGPVRPVGRAHRAMTEWLVDDARPPGDAPPF